MNIQFRMPNAPLYILPSEDQQKQTKNTSLHNNVATGDIDAVRILLYSGGCDIDDVRAGKTPLMTALEDGHKDIAKLLFARGAMVSPTPSGAAALGVLMKFLSDDCYAHKSRMNACTDHASLVHEFTEYAKSITTVKILMFEIGKPKFKAAFASAFSLRAEPFYTAKRSFAEPDEFAGGREKFEKLAERMIRQAAEVLNQGDKSKLNIHEKVLTCTLALSLKCSRAVKFMMNEMPQFKKILQTEYPVGPVGNVRKRMGTDLLYYAAFCSDPKSIAALLSAQMAKVDHRFDGTYDLFGFYGRGAKGTTPLMFAGMTGNLGAAQELLKSGADIGLMDHAGRTAFDIVAVVVQNPNRFSWNPKPMVDLLAKAAGYSALEAVFKSKDIGEVRRTGAALFELADRPNELKAALTEYETPGDKGLVIAAILAAFPAYVGVDIEALEARTKVLVEILEFMGQSGDAKEMRDTIADAYFSLQNNLHDGLAHGGAHPIFRHGNTLGKKVIDRERMNQVPLMEKLLLSIGFPIPAK